MTHPVDQLLDGYEAELFDWDTLRVKLKEMVDRAANGDLDEGLMWYRKAIKAQNEAMKSVPIGKPK